ncbi:MAG: hypothetical protein PHN56_06480 [Candidatus Nanoarchaeia archaeon]|nr:hypothetical protein [Candidatus Nanoarchaeia archaeon]
MDFNEICKITAYKTSRVFKKKQVYMYSNFQKRELPIVKSIFSKENSDFKFENPFIMPKFTMYFDSGKYFNSDYGIGKKISELNNDIIINMSFDYDSCIFIINSFKNKLKKTKDNQLISKYNNIISENENYLAQRKDDSEYVYGSGLCFDSTKKLGELIEEKINHDSRKIYWIQLLLNSGMYEHFNLLAFNENLEWMLLDGKRIIPEGCQDAAVIPGKIREIYPKNIIQN